MTDRGIRRWAAAALATLATFTLLRQNLPAIADPVVRLRPLAIPKAAPSAQARLIGAWTIVGRDRYAGGFSALNFMPDGRLLILADNYLRAVSLVPPIPGRAATGTLFKAGGGGWIYRKVGADNEALTHDDRHLWVVVEATGAIVRYSRGWLPEALRIRPEWLTLPHNRQVEALERLPDGRFLAIAEASGLFDRTDHQAFLYDGDPTELTKVTRFTFVGPPGYRPTDLTVLPDQSVAVLLRSVDWPALSFRAKIVRLNPRDIAAGQRIGGEEIGDLRLPGIVDNMEGLAAQPLPGGRAILWLVSDNNGLRLLQRSLLLAYRWDGDGTAVQATLGAALQKP